MEYDPRLLARSRAPRHRGRLPRRTHSATVNNPLCGDEIVVDVRVVDDFVAEVGFEAAGCAITIGAADLLADAVRGASVAEAAAHDAAWVHRLIGMVPPPGRRRCAELGLEALQAALTPHE